MIGRRRPVPVPVAPPEPADVTVDEVAASLEAELSDWAGVDRVGHVGAVLAAAESLGVPVAEDFRGRRTRFTTSGARRVFEHIRDESERLADRRWNDVLELRRQREAELRSPALPARDLLKLGVGAAVANGTGPLPIVHAYGPGESEYPPELAERVESIANGTRSPWSR